MKKQISKLIRCPRCQKECLYEEANPWRPFCCERCKLIDIGAWADESYRVAIPASSEDLEQIELETNNEES